jgi:hypothetical protein
VKVWGETRDTWVICRSAATILILWNSYISPRHLFSIICRSWRWSLRHSASHGAYLKRTRTSSVCRGRRILRTGKCGRPSLHKTHKTTSTRHPSQLITIDFTSAQHTYLSMADPAYSPPDEDNAADKLITLFIEDDEDE